MKLETSGTRSTHTRKRTFAVDLCTAKASCMIFCSNYFWSCTVKNLILIAVIFFLFLNKNGGRVTQARVHTVLICGSRTNAYLQC